MNEAEHPYSKIKAIIKQGKGLTVEFKECNTALNKDIYETVCAFLNRFGGELLLGVRDDGVITGIVPECLHQIKNDFTTAVNNPQKISPSFYLSMDEAVIDGKTILSIYIPKAPRFTAVTGKYTTGMKTVISISRTTTTLYPHFTCESRSATQKTLFTHILNLPICGLML